MLLDLREDLAVLVVRYDPTSLRYEANRRSRLQALVEEAQKVVSAAYVEIAGYIDRQLLEVASLTQDSSSALLASLLLIKGLSRRLDDDALRDARDRTLIEGATVRDWLARQSGDARFRVQRSLEGAMLVETLDQQPALEDMIEAVQSDKPGSLLLPLLHHAEGLIFSAFHAVATTVRLETGIRHPELFSGWVHLSIIDSKTTNLCRSRSNRRWYLDGTPVGHSLQFRRPPLHWRCRSHVVPVMLHYNDLPDRIKRRVREEDFPNRTPREPDLADWLVLHGMTRDDGPLDFDDARDQLGL
jgi:hypothetical protein